MHSSVLPDAASWSQESGHILTISAKLSFADFQGKRWEIPLRKKDKTPLRAIKD